MALIQHHCSNWLSSRGKAKWNRQREGRNVTDGAGREGRREHEEILGEMECQRATQRRGGRRVKCCERQSCDRRGHGWKDAGRWGGGRRRRRKMRRGRWNMRSGDMREKGKVKPKIQEGLYIVCVWDRQGGVGESCGAIEWQRDEKLPGETERDGMGCLSICNPGCNPRVWCSD